MTIDEYRALQSEFKKQDRPIRVFLNAKGISIHQYYYWMRKSNDLESSILPCEGQFLPIDVHSGDLKKIAKQSKSLKSAGMVQGEIEIELRTASGAELRIRGMMDAVMLSTIIASSGGKRNV